jgi:hypothetical protein
VGNGTRCQFRTCWSAPDRKAGFKWLIASGNPAFARDSRKHPQQLKEHEEKNMKRNTLVREASNDVLSPYVLAVAIKDDIAAEVTAMAMGWVPVDREDGTTIWVRLKDIGVDDVPYCDTALEVVRTYTH